MQLGLFDAPAPPDGFLYLPDVVTPGDEAAVLALLPDLPMEPFVMRGVPSRRKVAAFGTSYGIAPERTALPLPETLRTLRDRCCAAAGVEAEPFVQALVSAYPPGAGIGWHRDYVIYGPVVLGVSLVSTCRFRLRRKDDPKQVHTFELAPRSMYVLAGEARKDWEHAIPEVPAFRCSVTFRTLNRTP